MGDTSTSGGLALMNVSGTNAAKKAGEKAADRGLNAIIDFVKNKYGESKVKIGTVFDRYLENATLRYNQIRTLATGTTTRSIIGNDSLYVSIGVKYNNQEIDTTDVDSLLQISKNIIILGTGGVGKSMLTRYLFLDTAAYEGYVPVLIELRRIGTQTSGQLSIMNLIYDCMKDFDVELPMEQFEYSLRLGKYLFLFDGFDEVKSSMAKETAAAIQAFSAKYPNNSFIVTSRPRTETSPLETFTVMESLPLSKEQAVDLASRIWVEDEKTREFCQQLDEVLYEKHKDFAENPLLLSMMFLTFMRNSSIPDHLSDFYKKAYDALYSAHDNQDKGCYRRDFECKTLDENDFKKILSHFCFQSYFKEDYEFSKRKIISYLRNSLQKFGFEKVQATDYLKDLRNIVCMIIKDGETYRFSHRSFQAYFAAYYTAHFLTDEQQKPLFRQILSEDEVYWLKADYYMLLFQIEPIRFAENAIENGLRSLCQTAATFQNPDNYLLRTSYDRIQILPEDGPHGKKERILFTVVHGDDFCYKFNVLALFSKYLSPIVPTQNRTTCEAEIKIIKDYAKRILAFETSSPNQENDLEHSELELTFEDIDDSILISDNEREHLYNLIIQHRWANGIYVPITEWLSKLDAKRASLKSASFIDDL